jgi:hypothetical protein
MKLSAPVLACLGLSAIVLVLVGFIVVAGLFRARQSSNTMEQLAQSLNLQPSSFFAGATQYYLGQDPTGTPYAMGFAMLRNPPSLPNRSAHRLRVLRGALNVFYLDQPQNTDPEEARTLLQLALELAGSFSPASPGDPI